MPTEKTSFIFWYAGSDVTITGFYGETGQTATPRAMDYFLTAKSQCNYQAGADRFGY